jgi:hypothetical protein
MSDETKERQIERKTEHYALLASRHGVKHVIHFLVSVIYDLRDDLQTLQNAENRGATRSNPGDPLPIRVPTPLQGEIVAPGANSQQCEAMGVQTR